MSDVERTRACRGCGRLLHARDRCSCDTATVHVITDLGPTDGPGLVVQAELLGPALHANGVRMPLWYYNPFDQSFEVP